VNKPGGGAVVATNVSYWGYQTSANAAYHFARIRFRSVSRNTTNGWQDTAAATLQTTWPGGADHFDQSFGTAPDGRLQPSRLHPPGLRPGTGSPNTISNTVSSANPTGALTIPQANLGLTIIMDPSFEYSPTGVLASGAYTPAWQEAGGTGSVEIKNSGGQSGPNFARITGFDGLTQWIGQYGTINNAGNAPMYFSFSVRSNNPALGQAAAAGVSSGSGTGYTNGTYVVTTNGAGGTGAQFSVVIAGNMVVSITRVGGGSGYTNNTSFSYPVTAGGGTGITLVVFTTNHLVNLQVSAFDAGGSLVLVGGNAVNVFTVSGSVPSWAVGGGELDFPSNVAKIQIAVTTTINEDPTGYWDVDDVLLQPITSQTINGQTNTQNAIAQLSGSTAIAVLSTSTTARADYGLQYSALTDNVGNTVVLENASGTQAVICENTTTGSPIAEIVTDASGNATLSLTNGGRVAVMQVNGSNVLLQLIDGAGNEAWLTPDGFVSIGPGLVPYTGPLGGGRNCKGGIVF
jgi:hypothetical protein